jgi:hypothetical protein
MKATIRIDGLLVIDAETELEGYALKQWHEKSEEYLRNSPLKIVLTFDPMVAQDPDPDLGGDNTFKRRSYLGPNES